MGRKECTQYFWLILCFSFIMEFLVLILGCLVTCSQAQVLPNNLNCPFNNNIACRPDEKSCPMPNLGLLGCPAPPMCIPAKGKNDTYMLTL